MLTDDFAILIHPERAETLADGFDKRTLVQDHPSLLLVVVERDAYERR